MRDLFCNIIFPILCLPLAAVLVIGGVITCIWLGDVNEKLQARLQPLCPACRRRRLTHYPLNFPESRKYRYYDYPHCHVHLKRSPFGKWVTLSRDADNAGAYRALFSRSSSRMQRAPETETPDPLGSWFGSVQVGLPGETWPEYKGVPMLPLCQLRCGAIPTLPASLSDMALICVFIAFVGKEAISPEGDRWVVRTYTRLDDLVPLAYPDDPTRIRAYPISWKVMKNDTPPGLSSVPEAFWIDFIACRLNMRHSEAHSKVGGYRSVPHHSVPSQKCMNEMSPMAWRSLVED